jgi:hypothetical protein
LFTPDDIAFVQEAGVRAVSFQTNKLMLNILEQSVMVPCEHVKLAENLYCSAAGFGWRVDCETE